MYEHLNIPLDQTTRRGNWRVVWLFVLVVLFALLTWSVFRVITNLDSTGNFAPASATESMEVRLTSKTVKLLDEHLGAESAFPGHPIAFSDVLAASNSQIAIHYSGNETVGITINGKLKPEFKNQLTAANLSVLQNGRRTLITPIPEQNTYRSAPAINFRSISPLYSGTFFWRELGKKSILTVTKEYLRIRTISQIFNEEMITSIPQDSGAVFANIPLSLNILPSALLEPLSSNRAFADFWSQALQHNGSITLTAAEGRIGYSFVSQLSMSIDDLIYIGEEAMNRANLKTTWTTLEDGTAVQEIKTDRTQIQSVVSTDGSTSTAILTSTTGDTLRLTTDGSKVTISNLPSDDSATQPQSTCHPSSSYFVLTQALEQNLVSSEDLKPLINSRLTSFSEIALGPRQLYLCW